MRDIESLVETYLAAERDLVVGSAGGALPLSNGRTVTVGRAEVRRPARRASETGVGNNPQACTDARAAIIARIC
jgi:hypothetical protein